MTEPISIANRPPPFDTWVLLWWRSAIADSQPFVVGQVSKEHLGMAWANGRYQPLADFTDWLELPLYPIRAESGQKNTP